MSSPSKALEIVATHLNAAAGPVVRPEQVKAALVAGDLGAIEDDLARALVAYMFVEISPELVMRCVQESGCAISSANSLYLSTLRDSVPACPSWEKAMETLL